MEKVLDLRRRLKARKFRIRKKVHGAATRPRLSVYFSNKNVFAQIIDDDSGRTLFSLSTLEEKAAVKGKSRESAKRIGADLADKAKEAGITSMVFDRNGRRYHGKVKDFAEAIREKGILM